MASIEYDGPMAYTTEIEASTSIDGEHACSSCGARTRARVHAETLAGTGRHYGTPSSASLRAARAKALAGLPLDARDSLAMVGCPHCGRRSMRSLLGPALAVGLRAALPFGLLGGCGGFLVFVALGIGLDSDRRIVPGEMLPAVLGWTLSLALIGAWAMIAARFRRADRSVQFEEER
jgi:hypothetical protein